jgi:rhodanese-related sulfurtransferase
MKMFPNIKIVISDRDACTHKHLSGNIFLILLIFFVYSASAQTEYDEKLKSLYQNTVQTLQPELVKKLMKEEKVILLDTRSKEEFSISHLAGAQFLNYDSYTNEEFNRIAKNSKVIVYCSVGYRSERVGERLIQLGYKNVFNIYGGIFQWKNKGFEVVNKYNQPTDSVHTYNKDWSEWLQRGIKVY